MGEDALSKVRESLEFMAKSHEYSQKAQATLATGPARFYYEKLEGYVATLFERFAPFKKDDRVRIIKAPKCGGGWAHCKHFLVEGAEGTVHDVDCRDGRFNASVEFDGESWIDANGKERTMPKKDRHVFLMWESQIEPIDAGKADG